MAEGARVPQTDFARVQDAARWERGRLARIGQDARAPVNEYEVSVNVG